MMKNVARCVRIFDVDPSAEVISEYIAVTRQLRRRILLKRRVSGLFELVDGVSSVFREPASVPKPLSAEVERVFSTNLVSSSGCHGDIELGVCGLLAIVESLRRVGQRAKRGAWAPTGVLAAALWSALSFLPPVTRRKLESLRRASIDVARCRYLNESATARVRCDVQSIGALQFSEWSASDEACGEFMDLQINAALDEEEIEVLRWVLGGKSRICGVSFQAIAEKRRAVILGAELGTLMCTPPAQYHLELCGRWLGNGEDVSLSELINELGDERRKLVMRYVDASVVERSTAVFPLISAMLGCERRGGGTEVARSLSEWKARALLEFALVRSSSEGADTK